MSRSNSSSPSPNSPHTNITHSPHETTSRIYTFTQSTSNISIEHHPQPPHPPVASTPTLPDHLPTLKRPPSPDLQEGSSTMAVVKRLRRISPTLKQEEVSQDQISPSSDSQEPEIDPSDPKGKAVDKRQQDSPPIKKKRTRTLTTPHQAAVLHALLAQSRFPTTAMREEVGRSIGLSARKVQIWFQNQRQKARRPRKEPDESAPLPPRYGPFPAFPPQAHSTTLPVVPGPSPLPNPQLVPVTYNAPVQQPYGRPPFIPESSTTDQSIEPSGVLLGPGVPGVDSSYRSETRPHQREIALSQDTSTPHSSGSSSHLYSPRIGLQPPMPRPAAPSYDQNFNRTLPPLSFDSARPLSGGTTVSGGSQRHSPFITLPFPEPSRLRQRSSASPQVSHFVPQEPPDAPGHPRIILPPPFTLQPEPRWDDSSFSASLKPAVFARPRTDSQTSRASSASPASRIPESSILRRSSVIGEPSPPDPASTAALASGVCSAPSTRGGRYDPVRATFIPYAASRSVSSPTSSLHSQRNLADDPDDAQTSFREEP